MQPKRKALLLGNNVHAQYHPLQAVEQELMELHEGTRRPAAWAHEFGLGRVAYLMPGHLIHSLKDPM
jgi:hypothetical protein